MKNKIVRFSKSILTILIGIFLGLLILELSLRGLGYVITNWNKFTHIKTKQLDELRILALGDSMTQSGENPYPNQLQEILSNNPKINKEINVINGGIAGSASLDIMNHLESYLDQFSPDIVVIMTGINVDGVYDQWANIKNDNGLNKMKSFKLFKYLYQNFSIKINQDLGDNLSKYAYASENDVENIIDFITSKYSSLMNNDDIFKTQIEKDLYQKLSSSGINNEKIYIELIDYYEGIGNTEKQLISAIKAISNNKNNSSAYILLSADVTHIMTLEQREKLLFKALEINPNIIQPYISLGRLYGENVAVSNIIENNIFKDKELMIYKKGIEYNPYSSELWYWLGKYYFRYEKLSESENAFKKAISLNSFGAPNRISDIYQILAKIYQKQNKVEEANIALNLATESNIVLANNYPAIADILKSRGVKLIAMQYPLRDINILKNILKDYDVSYVDNKKSFEDAVKAQGTDKLFVDLFAGDFGHCTPEGNRIMAENVESEILKYLNLEK